MTDEGKKLYDIIAKIIEERNAELRISPAWIATEGMKVIDPASLSLPLVYLGCHLQLRQIARSFCRGKFEGERDGVAQHDLFPDLQIRYPSARSAGQEEPEYIRLEAMSDPDLQYNIDRLRRESMTKLRHADALEAYKRQRQHPRDARQHIKQYEDA